MIPKVILNVKVILMVVLVNDITNLPPSRVKLN